MSRINHQKPSLSPGLYALADADAAELRALQVQPCALAMLKAGISAVQLRAKGRSDAQLSQWTGELLAGRSSHTPLFINDRADLAYSLGAEGVHIGQGDEPVASVRQKSASLLCGISTHDLEQLEAAIAAQPDYIAFGPVFETSSKKNPEPSTGLSALRQAHARCKEAGIALVAIGGITEQNLAQVAPHCECIAAISLLLPEQAESNAYDSITERCRQLHERILQLQAEPG